MTQNQIAALSMGPLQLEVVAACATAEMLEQLMTDGAPWRALSVSGLRTLAARLPDSCPLTGQVRAELFVREIA